MFGPRSLAAILVVVNTGPDLLAIFVQAAIAQVARGVVAGVLSVGHMVHVVLLHEQPSIRVIAAVAAVVFAVEVLDLVGLGPVDVVGHPGARKAGGRIDPGAVQLFNEFDGY